MKRRKFLALAGATAASGSWPLAVRAQQSAMPVIGYLDPELGGRRAWLAAFIKGLGEAGFVEGKNVAIEYRSADGRNERMPELAADLVRRRVAVIAAMSPPAALAAKRAIQTIPIVFAVGADPVQIGLVSSFNRPGGNVTGFYFLHSELIGKRLSLLHELAPRIKRVAVLVNPANPSDTEPSVRNAIAAGGALGLDIQIFRASTADEINAAFAGLLRWQADALFLGPDPTYSGQRLRPQIVTLAAQHALVASAYNRRFVEDGFLMGYGPDTADSYRQAGGYVGRILKGEKPGDLPVQQPTKFEFVINLKTAKVLGIDAPPMVLARADEVIE